MKFGSRKNLEIAVFTVICMFNLKIGGFCHEKDKHFETFVIES